MDDRAAEKNWAMVMSSHRVLGPTPTQKSSRLSVTRKRNAPAILIALLFLMCLLPAGSASGAAVSVTLTETSEAFKNPMKGFRPSRYPNDGSFKDQEYATIFKHYIPYTNLENSASDPAQKITDWCNTAWAGIENKNIKIIPRVVIYYPGTGEWWPGGVPRDGTAAEWGTDVLKNRLVAFASKMAQAWDNDPRVAAIEMGLWGKWGEHNIYPDQVPGTSSDRIPASFQSALGTAFSGAFKNKKVMVRYENTFTDFKLGYIWDSFALPDDVAWANWESARDNWKTQMISGEVAYDWGNQSQLGGSPNGTLGSSSNTDYVLSFIRSTHCSSLGWIAEYGADGGTISANAARMQKEFGYRYVVTSASFQSRADAGTVMSVSFTVTNKGNAPFYYNWPLKANLLRSDKSVAWSGTFNADIRNWMPGNSYTVPGSFTVPSGLAAGTYILALTVNDPAGDLPSLRFANANYYSGGFTPLGKVGVGQDAGDQNLGSFSGLQADATLHYSRSGGGPVGIASSQQSHEAFTRGLQLAMVNGQLRISTPPGLLEAATITVFNCRGAQIARFGLSVCGGGTYSVGLQGKSSGVYIVTVCSSDKKTIGRRVVASR